MFPSIESWVPQATTATASFSQAVRYVPSSISSENHNSLPLIIFLAQISQIYTDYFIFPCCSEARNKNPCPSVSIRVLKNYSCNSRNSCSKIKSVSIRVYPCAKIRFIIYFHTDLTDLTDSPLSPIVAKLATKSVESHVQEISLISLIRIQK